MLAVASVSANPISKAKALQIAQEFMVPGHQMTVQIQAKSRRAAATNDAEATAPYYIISRGADQGFVIVAGDDCLPEVLGHTDHGDFDPNDLPPALQDMLDGWQAMIETAQADGSNVTIAAQRKAQRRAASNRVDIAPFVTSHWHQESPYNDHCPTLASNSDQRAVTGCVATAASQILYYWRKDLPSTLQQGTPTYSYGDAPVTRSVPKGTPMKWNLMLDKYGSEPSDFKEAVAEFVFATGAATWLTYGTSTSGNIENIPYTFSAYFGMNGGTVHSRNSYSQEAWTQLLYDELAKGRPVMYTGVHPDNGGHAVFIHGYRTYDDGFYFNFGWGDNYPYDGYYTTTQTDGMNGFSEYQSALIGAYPKTWNMTTTLTAPPKVYANLGNNFIIKIQNNSTLPFSGVYLFAETSPTKPSDLSKAKSMDTETIIPTGETKELMLTARPTSDRTWYFTVTDENLNVLDRVSVAAEIADNDLHLASVSVDSSNDTETLDGQEYQIIYSNKSTAYANIINKANYGYKGILNMNFYMYNEESREWTFQRTLNSTLDVDDNSSSSVAFSLASRNFSTGKRYKATLQNTTVATPAATIHTDDATQTDVYFILKGADMTAQWSANENTLSLSGHFDNTQFNTSFANRRTYSTATIYDLTQCTSVATVTQSINPNALIYVADDSQATGTNIIRASVCQSLSLTPGYNFTPRADFTAQKAQISIGGEPATWHMLTTPFTVNVPDGIVAHHILGHGINNFGSDNIETVQTLEAGKTYLVMAASAQTTTLTAENVTVVATPGENTDPAMVGTYITTTTPANAMLLNHDEPQKMAPTAEGSNVEALRGYWYADNTNKAFNAYQTGTDPAYLNLAKNIGQAYELLNKYSEIITPENKAAYLAQIKEAEHEFTHRGKDETSLTTNTLVNNYAKQLLANGETFVREGKLAHNMEVDFTEKIVNPSFERSSSMATGWTVGTKEGVTRPGTIVQGNLNNTNRSVGIDGKYLFQSRINSDLSSVGISQQVTDLTPGHYRLTAMLGTDAEKTVTLFADEKTTDVAGHSFGTRYLSETTIDDVVVMADEGKETGSLTIGVKEGSWYKVDNFTLTYIGALTAEEIATDIQAIPDTKASTQQGIYTLQGVKMSKVHQPGIYIINGKKRYIK